MIINIDERGPRPPLNSIFANQFKCITRVKFRVFVLEAATSGLHLTVMNVMQCNQGRIYHNMAQCQGPGALSDGETFFGLYLYLAERCCEKSQSARSPVQCKSGPCLVEGVTIYYNILNNNLPPSWQFLHDIITLKKISKGKCSLSKLLNLN